MQKRTKREKFLKEMEQVVPWERLEQLVEPHYPRVGKGRPPRGLKMMLRVYCLQQYYGLSDLRVEEVLNNMESMRRFVGLELGEDAIPDETTVLNFRRVLEEYNLTAAVFESVKAYLSEQGLLLSGGSIVDATIIHAPSSTKNRAKACDSEMGSTKKGNTWYFEMKANISVEANSVIGDLIREDGRNVFGDKGYASDRTLTLQVPATAKAFISWSC